MPHLHGLIVATPTPFTEEGKIDFDYVVEHLDFLRERGVDGVVPSGTNGEGPSLSMSERKELIKIVVDNRKDMFVIAGTGCASLLETIELTQYAEAIGADAALVVPPFFFKNAPTSGLVSYYSKLLSSTSIPVLLYNIPQINGVEISYELVEQLSHFPNLMGVKDSSGDFDRTAGYQKRFPHLAIYVGADTLIEKTAPLGVRGVISGLANAFPELIRKTLDLSIKGMGSEMQEKVNRLTDIFSRYPMFVSNKYVLTLKGFPPTYVRPPLVELTDHQKSSLEAELRSEGLIP